jgi:mRNA interferase RelE/StbE
MKYQIEITKSAAKEYKGILEPNKSRIKKKIDDLAELGFQSSNIVALTGNFQGLYRLRCGDFRIVFSFENEIITILAILDRKETYKKK